MKRENGMGFLRVFRTLSPVHVFALIILATLLITYMQITLMRQRQELEIRYAGMISQLVEQLRNIQEDVIQLNVEKVKLIQENEALLERVRFLEQCLSRPTPWPGQKLCPGVNTEEG